MYVYINYLIYYFPNCSMHMNVCMDIFSHIEMYAIRKVLIQAQNPHELWLELIKTKLHLAF